jgi:hypothetical protein
MTLSFSFLQKGHFMKPFFRPPFPLLQPGRPFSRLRRHGAGREFTVSAQKNGATLLLEGLSLAWRKLFLERRKRSLPRPLPTKFPPRNAAL